MKNNTTPQLPPVYWVTFLVAGFSLTIDAIPAWLLCWGLFYMVGVPYGSAAAIYVVVFISNLLMNMAMIRFASQLEKNNVDLSDPKDPPSEGGGV